MRVCGIICECNPFHDGHRRLLHAAREQGAEAMICVLSDPFVQRGEPAVMDARLRAGTLLEAGADAVLALPFPYAAAGAEFFASAGVSILSRLGADELWFGSECGSLEQLCAVAETVASEPFRIAYVSDPTRGRAAAFLELLCAAGAPAKDLSSNDLLGVAYLLANRALARPMTPKTIRRDGSDYRETALSEQSLPSATALRRALLAGTPPEELTQLPRESQDALQGAIASGEAPAAWKHAERAVLAMLRQMDPLATEEIAELSGGLGRRICQAAREARSLEELFALAASKTYTDARVRRGILFALCGITEADLRRPPAWTRLLGANAVGRTLLASVRRSAGIPVVTKASDLPRDAASLHAAALEERAYALWSLCLPSAASGGDFLRRPPQILK